MTTKDFSKMTTKKLNALLATASDEDKAAIQEILDSRAQVPATDNDLPKGQGWVGGDSEEAADEEAYEEAEKNGGKAPKVRRTDEEVEKLAEECRANVGHKCQVMPFNSPEWVEGVIVGVRGDKRAAQVFYSVKLDNGKSCVKAYDSNCLRIFDETVELGGRKGLGAKKEAWTEETMKEAIMNATANIGKLVTLEDGTQGRIVAIVPDKRVSSVLYRISVPTPTEVEPNATKTVHKVSTAAITIEADFDEIGADMNAKAVARRENAVNKVPTTPEDKLKKAQELVIKAEETLTKAQATLADRKAALEVAQQEFDAWAASQESLD